MKLTPNEETKIFCDLIAEMIFTQQITGHEAGLYLKMRGNAFYDHKKKKRNPCMKGAKVLSEELKVRVNKIQPKLKSLEKKGLIKPVYFVLVSGKPTGFDDLKFVEQNFSRRHIKFVEYNIKFLPGEMEAKKNYKKNKKPSKSITPVSKV